MQRAGGGATFPQIFIGKTHVGGCDELYALDREGKLDGLLGERRRTLMSTDNIFTAAMVQMRTGLLPEPSLEQGIKLIREAKAQGADYVLTPEVSNMMQLNRKALFEHLATEEDDKSLKAYRALAKELKIHLHIGSLALKFSPEKAVNRSFLIAPDGAVLACYDKIHMFDIDLPGGESYRESRQLPAGRDRRDLRPAVGPHRAHHLLRRALPGALPRAGRKRRVVPHRALGLHAARPAKRTGMCCCARARSRPAASCLPRRRPACMRTSARRLGIR